MILTIHEDFCHQLIRYFNQLRWINLSLRKLKYVLINKWRRWKRSMNFLKRTVLFKNLRSNLAYIGMPVWIIHKRAQKRLNVLLPNLLNLNLLLTRIKDHILQLIQRHSALLIRHNLWWKKLMQLFLRCKLILQNSVHSLTSLQNRIDLVLRDLLHIQNSQHLLRTLLILEKLRFFLISRDGPCNIRTIRLILKMP